VMQIHTMHGLHFAQSVKSTLPTAQAQRHKLLNSPTSARTERDNMSSTRSLRERKQHRGTSPHTVNREGLSPRYAARLSALWRRNRYI